MPQLLSAKKRARQMGRRTEVNRNRVSTVRTYIRKVEAAIDSGKKSDAEAALRAAEPHMMRGVRKGVMHRNTAARKLSRLSKRIKGMAA